MKRTNLHRGLRTAGVQPLGCVDQAKAWTPTRAWTPTSRGGATLTEVLMAVLVISVGVLAVMALFPIAFLRALQGTQLTNAVILKQQVETGIDLYDLVGDQFIPQPIPGNVTRCVIDPLGWRDRFDATSESALANHYGVMEGLQPRRYNPASSVPRRFTNLTGIPLQEPPGLIPLRRIGFAAGAAPLALNDVPLIVVGDGSRAPYSFGDTSLLPNRDRALDFVALPDKLDTQFSATPASTAATQAAFDADTIEADAITSLDAMLGAVPLRVVLIDSSGKRSLVREPNAFTATTIDWVAPLPPNWLVPPPAGVGPVSEVRVESHDLRYTWMLTVRKRGTATGSVTETDCVVFFNRAASDPEDELVHTAQFQMPGQGGDPDVASRANVTFTPYSDTSRTPPLRRGAYVFDPTYAEWYRVENILTESDTQAVIQLDRKPPQLSSMPGATLQTTLVVPRGVIAVFPMDARRSEGV